MMADNDRWRLFACVSMGFTGGRCVSLTGADYRSADWEPFLSVHPRLVPQTRVVVTDSTVVLAPPPGHSGPSLFQGGERNCVVRHAHRAGRRRVLVLAPTGKAVDVAVREGAGDAGYTVAKALRDLRSGALTLDADSLVIVDEAGMIGTPDLHEFLTATTNAGAKTVLVGDARQLAPVKARGGMFDQLCDDLPWARHVHVVWPPP
jgi:ATP-dependent exoDNAse (exonuclease V) alpha subunit